MIDTPPALSLASRMDAWISAASSASMEKRDMNSVFAGFDAVKKFVDIRAGGADGSEWSRRWPFRHRLDLPAGCGEYSK